MHPSKVSVGPSVRFECIKHTKNGILVLSTSISHRIFQLDFESASILQRKRNKSFDSRFCDRIYARRCRLTAHQSLRFEAHMAVVHSTISYSKMPSISIRLRREKNVLAVCTCARGSDAIKTSKHSIRGSSSIMVHAHQNDTHTYTQRRSKVSKYLMRKI